MAKLIPTATRYDRPETLEELELLLKDDTSSAFLLAGGTSLAFSRPAFERIIDMNRLPLKGCQIKVPGDLEIGALTTIGDLERDPAAAAFCGGILLQSTDKLASTPLRNLITTGGTIASGYPWSDLPVVFLALDARLRMLDMAHAGVPGDDTMLLPHDGGIPFRSLTHSKRIISHVILDGGYAHGRGAFTKFARTASDLALVSVAVTCISEENSMRSVRVAAGGLTAVPQRLPDVERMLEGQSPEKRLFEAAGDAAVVSPRPDTRASADYRLDVLKTLVTRTCLKASGELDDEN